MSKQASKHIRSLGCISFNTKVGIPASIREQVSFSKEELKEFWERLISKYANEEAGLFYLATCHRIELYFYALPAEEILHLWTQYKGSVVSKISAQAGEKALAQLFQVTSSVESEVLGETQITGQVKDAANVGKEIGYLRGPLERWVQQSLRVAKRVRNETDLSRGTVSVAHVAVDGMLDFFDQFEDKTALVIGAGSMAIQSLERLLKIGIGQITWVNRTRDKIATHPLAHQVQIADFEMRHQLCLENNITVVATSSDENILNKSALELLKAGPRASKIDTHLLLDLGLPRNIDEQIHGFRQFYVRNVDEFRDRAGENLKSRLEAKSQAQEIIEEELLNCIDDSKSWERGPLIGMLQEALGSTISEEIENLKLEKTRETVYISRVVQGKLLHKLLKEMESLESDEALEILRFLNRAWRRPDSWLQKPNLDPVQSPPEKPLP